MREIVLDTETTGLRADGGDRLVEIACLELVNHLPTGEHWQAYINPERDMPPEAERIHGLSAAFLSDKPRFAEVAGPFLDFIGDSPLVIHNAGFDLAFLNMEMGLCNLEPLPPHRAVDTVQLARRLYPGSPASLDALCRRFAIDTTERSLHGGLVDARLLAEVYLELIGGRQPGLGLAAKAGKRVTPVAERPVRPARPHQPTAAEEAAHAVFVARLENSLWEKG
ncbi:MAG: DNA polymerase III subunit epsilon [Alphaproteobacteria bacterium]